MGSRGGLQHIPSHRELSVPVMGTVYVQTTHAEKIPNRGQHLNEKKKHGIDV